MKKITRVLMVAVLLSGLAVFSGNAIFAQTTKAANTEKSAEASVENTDVIIRVVAVKDSYSNENDVMKPKPGNKFVAVQVVIDNSKGTKDWSYETAYFKLKDSENQTYVPSFFNLAKPRLEGDLVDGGDSVKGWLTFEISNEININSLKIRYEWQSRMANNFKSEWIFLSAVK